MGLKETFYISHGSPTISIDDKLPARHFLQSFKESVFSQRPSSILVISGHWETEYPTVNVVSGVNETIYDFYNFPEKMYQLTYPAPGAPELAKKVKQLLISSGFDQVYEDTKRGLDHGAWIPLMLMYPQADIPVCQLSVQTHKDATHHYYLGKALVSLKEEGVLIIGSGAATHNLDILRNTVSNTSWAMEFDNWLKDALLDGRYQDINEYLEKAPHPKLAHPLPDHFYPLHVAMGASGEGSKAKLIHTSWSPISYLSYSSYKKNGFDGVGDFYISHGSPTLSIDETLPARKFLQSFKEKVFPQRPSSILVISGHWQTEYPTVNVISGANETIYDFYNFPKKMYQLKYPAAGAPKLAKRVKELLMSSGFDQVYEDKKRGLDHGAWVPLMLMYPDADIPVCQLSVQTHKDATYHFNLGKALVSLKEEGVLVIGSGSAVHNLRALRDTNTKTPWALEFDTWLTDALVHGRYDDINQYLVKAPHPKLAHPSPDHFYPLHIAMGASGEGSNAELIHTSWSLNSLSYSSYKFTAP